MTEKQKKIGYLSAIQSRFGLCPIIAGAFVLLAIAYVFLNVDLFGVIETSGNATLYYTLLIVAAGLIGGAFLAWAIISSFKKKAGFVDCVLLMTLIFGVGLIVLNYMTVGFDVKHISIVYFVALGLIVLSIVLLIVHSTKYQFEENKYQNYRGLDANANFVTYYKELFRVFPAVWMGVIGVLVAVAIFLLDSNPEVALLASTEKGKIIVYVLSIGAVASYLAGLIIRTIKKKIELLDLGIFVLDVAAIVSICISLYNYFFTDTQDLLRLVISGAAVIFGLVYTIVLMISTYIPISVEEQLINQEILEKQEEATVDVAPITEELEIDGATIQKDAVIEETVPTEESVAEEENNKTNEDIDSIDEEDEEMAEQIKAIVEQLTEQNKVNNSIYSRLDNIDKNLQLIAEILKGIASEPVGGGAHVIEVPIGDGEILTQEQNDGIEEEPEAVAVEPIEEAAEDEVATMPDDYFEQVEETAAAEEKIEKIATDYVEGEEETDWIATADQDVRIKPKLSFPMRLRVADEDIKKFYTDIKNELLSYGIHNRISAHRENFNQGRINICRMVINGKTLKVYLAVDPSSIDAKYYHQIDVGHRKGATELPTMINVRSKVAARKVKELITLIMESLVIAKKPYEDQDFHEDLSLEGFTTVQCKGFDYLIKDKIKMSDVLAYPDTFAGQLIDVVEDEAYQEKFIKTTLTIEEIEKNFEEGSVVDVEAVRKKHLGPSNANYLLVQESDSLDKKYKVYANEFTPNAVKMICLAGGEAFLVVQPQKTIEEA